MQKQALHSAQGDNVLEIIGTDYAFRVPDHVKAGPTTFTFTNRGKVFHEFNINMLARGVTPAQFMAALRAGTPTKDLREGTVGVLFAEPGKKSIAGLSTVLRSERDYVVICIMRDSARAPRHHDMGMFSVIRPSGPSVNAAVRKVDTIIATDYAFSYSRTLSPGHHAIAFVNRGKQRHEVNVALFKPGATVAKLMAVDKAKGDVNALFDAPVGVLHGYGGTTPQGVFEIDLLPGREYYLECGFQDTDSAPPHHKLGMLGSIRVSGVPAKK